MSHDITVRTDGTAEAAFALTPAWHGLGEVVDHALTSEEAIRLAQLDWTVEARPIAIGTPTVIDTPDGPTEVNRFAPHDGHVANVRTDTNLLLGIVSSQYKILQNVEAFAFLDSLVQDGILKYESAFSLGGGKEVVILAQYPREYQAAPGDTVQPYIALTTGHGGGKGIQIGLTTVRIVCQNTLRLAISKGGFGSVSLRHDQQIADKLSETRSALKLVDTVLDQNRDESQRLAQRKLSRAEWQQFLDVVCPLGNPLDPDYTLKQDENIRKTRDAIEVNYFDDPKQHVDGISETAWAGYNAISQHIDHLPRRGNGDVARSESRFRVTQYGTGHALKQKAWKTALAFAK